MTILDMFLVSTVMNRDKGHETSSEGSDAEEANKKLLRKGTKVLAKGKSAI